jgi:hypothetical protein
MRNVPLAIRIRTVESSILDRLIVTFVCPRKTLPQPGPTPPPGGTRSEGAVRLGADEIVRGHRDRAARRFYYAVTFVAVTSSTAIVIDLRFTGQAVL